jgi:TPR repeat protein
MKLPRPFFLAFILLLAACTAQPKDEMPPPPAVPAVKVDAEADAALLAKAEAGDKNAQFMLGESLCCANPLKEAEDTEARNQQATEWLCRAAGAGQAEAQYKLGEIYSGDLFKAPPPPGDMRRPLSVGLMWYEIAAENHNAASVKSAAQLKNRLSADEISEADRLKANWQQAPCVWNDVYK